ncbi:acyltransferase family protein [Bacillus sp. WLY-B-L8]|uniref:acyltransferase family protein n=1 Tax=Bacillus multifaciens TaxID=3068506 RepID=UPI0027429457|nr:acyltransferase [Bacillus sp. WLY-B-L8]MDP7977900.1 acyltransferase [Bacillus sp. WLY-B-L8]
MEERYKELDSLRGLAALFVVIGHHFMIFSVYENYHYEENGPFLIFLLKETPARIIFSSGNESVVFFFILSGFVLYKSIYSSQLSYCVYFLKRFCRIYIPYVVALFAAIICQFMFSDYGISSLSQWFNKSWTTVSSPTLILQHLLFIGVYNTDAYNNVIWSLVHEMRISIIFPVLLIFFFRNTFRYSVILLFSVNLVSIGCLILFHSTLTITSYTMTLHYSVLFLLGALLAKYKDQLTMYYSKKSAFIKFILFTIAIILYLYEGIIGEYPLLNNFLFRNYVVSLGACMFIILSMSSSFFSLFLSHKYFNYLGKISYSLYLYHAISLFSFIYIFYGQLPVGVILFISFLFSFIIASLAYVFIEKPITAVGNYITKGTKQYRKSI